MLATLLAVSQPIRGQEHLGLNIFSFTAAVACIALWIVAASYRSRRSV